MLLPNSHTHQDTFITNPVSSLSPALYTSETTHSHPSFTIEPTASATASLSTFNPQNHLTTEPDNHIPAQSSHHMQTKSKRGIFKPKVTFATQVDYPNTEPISYTQA